MDNRPWHVNLSRHSLGDVDPRPWVKILGIIEIIISIIGLLILVCLELIVIDLTEEVNYIHGNNWKFREGPQAARLISGNLSSYTLNATFTCDCDCNTTLNSIRENLQTALESKGKLVHEVKLHRTEGTTTNDGQNSTLCEILITTTVDPYEKHGLPKPIAKIVEDAIEGKVGREFKLPTKQAVEALSNVIQEHLSKPLQIERDNVKKSDCINYVKIVKKEEVRSSFDQMQTLMMIAAACSVVVGFFVYFSFQAKRPLLIGIFCMELVCIGLLIGAVVSLNQRSLCLLEYGGINPAGKHSTKYAQTTMTVICTLYLVLFKLFSLVVIGIYAVNAPRLKPPRRFTKPSDVPVELMPRKSEKRMKSILGTMGIIGTKAAPVYPERRRLSIISASTHESDGPIDAIINEQLGLLPE